MKISKILKASKKQTNLQEQSTGTRKVFWGKLDHDLRHMSNLIFEKFLSEISEVSPQKCPPKNGGGWERKRLY